MIHSMGRSARVAAVGVSCATLASSLGACFLGACLLGACGGDPVPPVVLFEAVAPSSGFRFRHELPGGRMDNLPKAAMGGLAVIDADGDGRLDLYFVNGGWHESLGGAPRPERPAPNRLLRNLGDLNFADVTEGSGADDTGFGMGACVGDFDNDGAADLFVCNYGGSRLLRGLGDGTFEDVTERSGITPGSHTGAAFLDYDRDGLLDLFVAQYVDIDVPAVGGMAHGMPMAGVSPPAAFAPQPAFLYHNRGDGTFEDVTRAAGVGRPGKAMGVLATDIDVDGWIDIVVANDAFANFVWRNRGDGTFEDVAPALGMAYGLDAGERGSMGVDAGDIDGDGRLDYLLPDTVGGCVFVAKKTWFTDRAKDLGFSAMVRPSIGWADVVFDADLDGDMDVYKTHGAFVELKSQTSFLLLNEGEAGFDRLPAGAGADWEACARGGVAVDLDDDGLQEIVAVALEGDALLLANRTRDAGNWVRLRLQGTTSNRMALGARVTGRVDGRVVVREISGSTGYISAGDPRALFGLGDADELTDVSVRWPNGAVEEVGTIEAGHDALIVERAGVR